MSTHRTNLLTTSNGELASFIKRLMADIRVVDYAEMMVSVSQSPLEQVVESIDKSTVCYALEGPDGNLLAIYGMCPLPDQVDTGIIWALGTVYADTWKVAYAKESKLFVNEMLQRKKWLYNFVWERNTVSLVWLDWLGFTKHHSQPMGVNGENFHLMTKEA